MGFAYRVPFQGDFMGRLRSLWAKFSRAFLCGPILILNSVGLYTAAQQFPSVS